jgi:hypothetical protein
MPRSHHFKSLFRLGMLLAVLFAVHLMPAHAVDSTSISVNFGNLNFGTVTIGMSFPLYIHITAGPNPVRATSLQCFQKGTSLSASSISHLPNSSVITEFSTVQYYRAASAGSTAVRCDFNGIDTVTGEAVFATSNIDVVNVSGETRFYATAYSATKTATVGQAIFLTVKYGNRGKNTLTDAYVSCTQLGHGIAFVSSRQTQTTLPSGQSGFAEYRLEGLFHGASGFFLCSAYATDSGTGETITILTQGISINII